MFAWVAEGTPGIALLLAAALLPVPFLLWRSGWSWSLSAGATLLGLIGIAGAWPVVAGQVRGIWTRAALGALGAWWLLLAEHLLDERLLLGRGASGEGFPDPAAWRDSVVDVWTRVIDPIITGPTLALCAVWAVAAAVLPLVVRGRTAAIDMVGGRGLGDRPRRGDGRAGDRGRRSRIRAGSSPARSWRARLPSSRARCDHGRDPARRTGRANLTLSNATRPRPYDPRAMSVLRNLERTIAGLVEGTFGRVFRSEVRPVEVARRLAREMDEHKTVSVSRTYVPNEYAVWLSPRDRENFAEVEHELSDELGALPARARAPRALRARVAAGHRVQDRRAAVARRVRHPGAHGAQRAGPRTSPRRPSSATRWSTPPPTASAAPVEETSPPRPVRAAIVAGGAHHELGLRGGTIGRSRECDVVLDDRNVSRRHAEIRIEHDGTWTVHDLGSTNGVRVNGRPVGGSGETLRAGDAIELGTAEVVFELE